MQLSVDTYEKSISYGKAWNKLRRDTRAIVFWWLAGPFLSMLIMRAYEPLGMLAFVGAVIMFFRSGAQVANFLCPRCGGRYFRTDYGVNQLQRTCKHCGLKKYAGPDDGAAS